MTETERQVEMSMIRWMCGLMFSENVGQLGDEASKLR